MRCNKTHFPVVKLSQRIPVFFLQFESSPALAGFARSLDEVVAIDVQVLAVLLEQFEVQFLATESSDAHVFRLVSEVLVGDLARALLGISLVEGLRLIELLAVLSSVLIRVEVTLGGPGSAVPERRIHRVARAVVVESLSRTVQVLLVLNVLVEFASELTAESPVRNSITVDLRGVPLRIDVAGTEGRLVGLVMRVVVRMSEGLSASAITPGGCIQRLVGLPRVQMVVRVGRANLRLVEAGRRHMLLRIIELFLLEDIAALLSEGLLQERVGGDLGPIALVTGQDVVLPLN